MRNDIAKPSKASRWQVLAHGEQKDDGVARCPQGHIHLDYGNVSLRYKEQEFLTFADMVRAAAAMRVKQRNSGMSTSEVARVRELQDAVRDNPTIAPYIAAQQVAQAYLPLVNQAISEQLGIGFAVLGKSKTC